MNEKASQFYCDICKRWECDCLDSQECEEHAQSFTYQSDKCDDCVKAEEYE